MIKESEPRLLVEAVVLGVVGALAAQLFTWTLCLCAHFAGLHVPAGLNPSTNTAINESIGEAFVFGFRIVMLACAGLSLGSAAVAWLMIPKARDRSGLDPSGLS